jgi:hypothetical protein
MKLSRKDAAYWLNEAWAPENEILPRHVRLAGDWLFYHDPDYPKDVSCIHDPKGGDLCAEPYCDIPFADSPFVEKDKTKLAKTLAKLDDEIDSGYFNS